ncbi:TIGR04372 family glycosyltransferase [Elusimicrobiota bacterium]
MLQKCVRAAKFLLLYVAMAPVLLLLFLLRPFVLIRVGSLRTATFGHCALNIELYLCELDAGLHPSNAVDIFYHDRQVRNHQLAKMWSRGVRVHPFAYYLRFALDFWPGFGRHVINTHSRDRHGIFDGCKPHLSFSRQEVETGRAALERLGVGRDPYICINARDSAYKKAIEPGLDWSYHDYNNMDVNAYVPAIESLARRGFYILRMGSVVGGAVASSDPRLIDYATNGMRTDFLDIYLPAGCRFFVSNGTGIDTVPKIFHRPVLYVNQIPLEYLYGECAHDLMIPKKLRMRDEDRFMGFREIIESGVGRFLRTEQYEERDLEIIDNTPAEIEAATMEMLGRLEGTWKTTDEDEELQRRFWALLSPSDDINKVFRSRIGAQFLRENRDLLG